MEEKNKNQTVEKVMKMGLDCFKGNVMFTDAKGNILFANEYLLNLYNLTYDEATHMTSYDLVSRGILDKSAAVEALETKKVSIRRLTTSTGKELDSVGYPIFDENGNLTAVAAYSYDGAFIKELMREINNEKEKNKTIKNALQYYMDENGKTQFVTASPVTEALFQSAAIIAQLDSTVLICGESGTGKEVMANFIHRNSKRANEIFMPVNCGAIPKDLMEAEFFGYEKGAFTGADKNGKMGLFEIANNGTLFLDEIAELPLSLQAKLLRVLETGEIKKVGGSCRIFTNARIIAATNKNLSNMVKNGQFREDLYYRLNVIPINIPPLRERKEDIEAISKMLCQKFNKKYDADLVLTQDIIDNLKNHNWPGNVRELKNEIERMVIYTKTGERLRLFASEQNIPHKIKKQENETDFSPKYGVSLKETVHDFETFIIKNTIKQCGGNIQKSAKLLGVDRSSIYKKLKK